MSEEVTAETPESTATESADASKDVQTETTEKPEGQTEETASTDESTDKTDESDAEKTATEPKPKKSKSSKRIAELSYENRVTKRVNARLLSLLEKQQSQGAPKSDAPPKIEDFETIDEFLDARDSYRDGKSEKTDTSEDYAAKQEEYTREAIDDLRMTGTDKYEDFDDVVFAEDVKISPVMRDAILVIEDEDLRADVAYFLGNNPKEGARITKLAPLRQVTEIGKLEAKIANKPAPKRPSAAPKPIKPVGGAKTSSDAHQPDDDMKTFIKKRNKELGRG